MPDFFDRLENRTPAARETALFRDLAHVMSISRSRSPALRAQLKGIDPARVRSRDDLAAVPLRRRADLLAAQGELGGFGGFVATRLAGLAQVFAAPQAMLSVAGSAKDWWGMGRALYAAGLRKGTLVLNALPYDLSPFGHMVEAGARVIGSPVLPAGNAPAPAVLAAMRRTSPGFYCGTADGLRALLDAADEAGVAVPFKDALLLAPLKPGPRSELALRGIAVHLALALPEMGVVAFESGSDDGLLLAEGYIGEIVGPDGLPVAAGDEGELVLSRINLDYPLLRYGTGLISAVLPQPSRCGRTNMRLVPPRPGAETIHIAILRRHFPGYAMQLTMPEGRFHLRVEERGDEPALAERLEAALQAVTRQRGTVEMVRPGALAAAPAPAPTNGTAGG